MFALPSRAGLPVAALALAVATGASLIVPAARANAAVAPKSARPAAIAPALTHTTAYLPVVQRPKLRRGSTGRYVRLVQRTLGVSPTGYFGRRTQNRVRAFQARTGLRVTGVVGLATWRAIDVRRAALAKVAPVAAAVPVGDPTRTAAARTSSAARKAIPLAVWRGSAYARMVVSRESGGSCSVVSGGGMGRYHGTWQMTVSLWTSFGGLIFATAPDKATCAEQDQIAYKVWIASGWTPWSG